MDCGDCKECCTALPVVELNKPMGVRCDHVCENGCGVYANRPESCQTFLCMWLQMPEVKLELRPDKCGVIFERKDEKVAALITGKVNEYALAQFSEFKKQGFRVFFNHIKNLK